MRDRIRKVGHEEGASFHLGRTPERVWRSGRSGARSENRSGAGKRFELNKKIVRKAETNGLDFVLTMIEQRGLRRQDRALGSQSGKLHVMAGLAAVTSRIKIYATAATLILPPAIVARIASTNDFFSNSRFSISIAAGEGLPGVVARRAAMRHVVHAPCGRPMQVPISCSAGPLDADGHSNDAKLERPLSAALKDPAGFATALASKRLGAAA